MEIQDRVRQAALLLSYEGEGTDLATVSAILYENLTESVKNSGCILLVEVHMAPDSVLECLPQEGSTTLCKARDMKEVKNEAVDISPIQENHWKYVKRFQESLGKINGLSQTLTRL